MPAKPMKPRILAIIACVPKIPKSGMRVPAYRSNHQKAAALCLERRVRWGGPGALAHSALAALPLEWSA